MLIKILYLTLCSFAIISALKILTSLNQISRLGFIIKVFIFNALIFIILDNYFLGLTYIIVYVGAISVLFLFVIKKISSRSPIHVVDESSIHKEIRTYDLFLILFIFSLILVSFVDYNSVAPNLINNGALPSSNHIYSFFFVDYFTEFLSFSDIESLGFILFLAYPLAIILIGIILWIILIGILRISNN